MLLCHPWFHQALAADQSGIQTVMIQQSSVTSAFYRAALMHDHHLIGVTHRGKPVRDHDRGTALPQPRERHLDGCLALRVERAGRLVEQQDARIAQQRARQGHPLPLAARQPLAAWTDPCREPVRQCRDEP